MRHPPAVSDPEAGIFQGRSIARRFVSPDGYTVLVGKAAADNDTLTFRLGAPRDFWLHVAAESGSHVIVRNPEGVSRLPRETLRFAAALAAGYSKARAGGRVAVHVCTCGEVHKPRGLPPGKVTLDRFETMHAAPSRGEPDPVT
ncbi:MAG: NFACT RNA binding domain-containing protein [Acidobacteriota bacterium]